MTVREYNQAVQEYSDKVYRFILGNIKDIQRAEDIVQDSYEKLWRNVTEIEFSVARSWLFSTAYHTMIDILRKDSRMTRIEPVHEKESIYDRGYSDLNEILQKAFETLPEAQKTAVMLRDYEGYSYKEISEITGSNEAQVKTNIYRGRVALKTYIGTIETVL